MINLSECINVVLNDTQNLLTTTLVNSTYFHLVELFVRKEREVEAQVVIGQMFSRVLQQAIKENRQSISTMIVFEFSPNSSFVVKEVALIGGWSQRNYRVRLTDR